MSDLPAGYVSFREAKARVEAQMTAEEWEEYRQAEPVARAQIEMAELVYEMRTRAGLTQEELADRMGAAQPFVSALEHGARQPTVATLNRIAQATGNRLEIRAVPA